MFQSITLQRTSHEVAEKLLNFGKQERDKRSFLPSRGKGLQAASLEIRGEILSYNKNNMFGVVNFLEMEDEKVVRKIFLDEHLTHLELTDSGAYKSASYDPGEGVYIELPHLTSQEIALLEQSPEKDFRAFPFFARLEQALWNAWNALPGELFDEEEDTEE